VEYGRGDVWQDCIKDEHNHFELNRTCKFQDYCLLFNVIELQLSFHSLFSAFLE